MWNVITADFRSLCSLILLQLFFVACTGASLWGALEVQSSNSNIKLSRGQVHSLSVGPTRGYGVRLTCQSMHFHSFKISKVLKQIDDFTTAVCI